MRQSLVQASTRSVKLGCDAISACMPRAAVRNHRSHEMNPPMIADATPGDRPDRIIAVRNFHGCNQSVEREVEIFSLSTTMKCGRTRPGQKDGHFALNTTGQDRGATVRRPPRRLRAAIGQESADLGPGPVPGGSRCRSRPESPGRSKMLTASRRCSPSEGEHLRKKVSTFEAVSITMHALGVAGSSGRGAGPARVARSGPARAGRASPADRPSAGHPARGEIRVVSLASAGGGTGAGGGVRREVSEFRFIFPDPAIAV